MMRKNAITKFLPSSTFLSTGSASTDCIPEKETADETKGTMSIDCMALGTCLRIRYSIKSVKNTQLVKDNVLAYAALEQTMAPRKQRLSAMLQTPQKTCFRATAQSKPMSSQASANILMSAVFWYALAALLML